MATSGSATSVKGGVTFADAAHGDQDRALVALLVDGHRRHELGQMLPSLTCWQSDWEWPNALMAIGVSCRLVSRSQCGGDQRFPRVGWHRRWPARGLSMDSGRGDHGRHEPRNRPTGFCCGASSPSLSLRAIFLSPRFAGCDSPESRTTSTISFVFAI